ncbi:MULTISPECIES: DUF2911 domain-containing protein [unclassified Leeuwenhoekiella]|uniref:DUF2911 domain-containing protein n=1 Tax=unclassified Leeuwenhoekiella TaxID=2615029 RepID=UPI000C416F3B|nr:MULTISPECIES: DUF2911 domain-containing protein [unclassified Leeuwenhoekiella]MAW95721.1 asparagine synthetase B [Leeuwenhoekiella sp.]MBA81204.1 asparagine synthetase B [Leeuwenhoekiella sp.]|tara:strand:+ start:22300 stop:22842 length:543 start_codon:yes stop_codon:yes gene_type:complete
MNYLVKTLVIAFLLAGLNVEAQKFSEPDKSPLDIAMYRGQDKAPRVRVIYSRPQKKGREIFGKLEKYGEVWRTGANESTEIKFYEDMMVGDKLIPAGTYTLFTIPGQKEWTVILNKDLDTWGAYGYKKERDLARFTTPAHKTAAPIESFSISFQPTEAGSDMFLGWDDTYIQIPIEEVEE